VCGLKWSPDNQYLASGGNDNRLLVWSHHVAHDARPLLAYEEHVAAVKAIAWSPHHHGLLASGGGTADRCIKFWNTLSGQPLRSIETESQVCNLAWSEHTNELVSTHGYSQNQILVWQYPNLRQLAKLTGHTSRVLYLAVSPDGENIVTGAGDETLRFWNVFCRSKSPKKFISNNVDGVRLTYRWTDGSFVLIKYEDSQRNLYLHANNLFHQHSTYSAKFGEVKIETEGRSLLKNATLFLSLHQIGLAVVVITNDTNYGD
ncbi:Fizzy-related protein, partial [Hymenolepis weldensis]